MQYDGQVSSVQLIPRETVEMPADGLALRGLNGAGSRWRNKVYAFQVNGSFSVARIMGSKYPMILRLYAYGVLVCEMAVEDDADFLLPPTLPDAKDWRVDLEQAGELYELYLMARIYYAVADGKVVIRRQQDPWTWLDKRIVADRSVRLIAGRVIADSYPVMVTLYHGGAQVAQVAVRNATPFRLPRLPLSRLWRADFTAAPGVVIQEAALAQSMESLRG